MMNLCIDVWNNILDYLDDADKIPLVTNTQKQLTRMFQKCSFTIQAYYREDLTIGDKFPNIQFIIDVSPLNNYGSDNTDKETSIIRLLAQQNKIHTLIMENNELRDTSIFATVKNLHLSHCIYLSNVNSLKNLTSLTLHECHHVKDVSMLSNITYLDLINCSGITDVSPLKNARFLNLANCRNVSDVSFLGQVHTLILDNTSVVNVSALKNVHTLHINYCKVSNIDTLTNVRELSIISTQVENIDSLVNVLDLNISFTNVYKVTTLHNIQSITTTQKHIVGLNTMQTLTVLRMRDYEHTIDFSFFTRLKFLSLTRCAKATNLNALTELVHLNIGKTAIDDMSLLCDVKYALLSNIKGPINFPVFKDARRVSMFGCRESWNIKIAGNIDHLVIDVCEDVTELCITANIRDMSLMYMPYLFDIIFDEKTVIENVRVCDCLQPVIKRLKSKAKNVFIECFDDF